MNRAAGGGAQGRSSAKKEDRKRLAEVELMVDATELMAGKLAEHRGGVRIEVRIVLGGHYGLEVGLCDARKAIEYLADGHQSGITVSARISPDTAYAANKAVLELARRHTHTENARHFNRGAISQMGNFHATPGHAASRKSWTNGSLLRRVMSDAADNGLMDAHAASAFESELCEAFGAGASLLSGETELSLRVGDTPMLRDLKTLLVSEALPREPTFKHAEARLYCLAGKVIPPTLEEGVKALIEEHPPEVSGFVSPFRPSKRAVFVRTSSGPGVERGTKIHVAVVDVPVHGRVMIAVGSKEECSFAIEVHVAMLMRARLKASSVPEAQQSRLGLPRGTGSRAARLQKVNGEEMVGTHAKKLATSPMSHVLVWPRLISMNESVEQQVKLIPATKALVSDEIRKSFLKFRNEATDEYRQFRLDMALFLRARHVARCRARGREPHELFFYQNPGGGTGAADTETSEDCVVIAMGSAAMAAAAEGPGVLTPPASPASPLQRRFTTPDSLGSPPRLPPLPPKLSAWGSLPAQGTQEDDIFDWGSPDI